MSDQIQNLQAKLLNAEKQNAILGNLLLESNKRVAANAANSEILNEKLVEARKSIAELREAHDAAIDHVKKVQSDLDVSNGKNEIMAKSLDDAIQKIYALEHIQESGTDEVDSQLLEEEPYEDNVDLEEDPEPVALEDEPEVEPEVEELDVNDSFSMRRKKATKVKTKKKAR